MPKTGEPTTAAGDGGWRTVVSRYQTPSVRRATVQLATTLIPFAALFTAMAFSLSWSYWWTLLLALPTAGFFGRTFIIMHDCAHNSFLPSRKANDIVGAITGYLTLTPFAQWRRDHAIHHASSGDLDRRGHGDIDTITVREYLALSPSEKFWYRMKRNPFGLLLGGPIYLLYSHRFQPRSVATKDKQLYSVWGLNVAIVITLAAAWLLGILPELLLVYGPVLYIALAMGMYLFYVQHQFEDTYWEEHKDWNYTDASFAGSSYLKLPAPLAWITGNIGLHHVHHLGPKIPNYNLRRAYDENPMFHEVTTLRLRDTLGAMRLALWDEERGRLVSFKDIRDRSERAPLSRVA